MLIPPLRSRNPAPFLIQSSKNWFLELPANELAGFPVDRPTGLSLPRLPEPLGLAANSFATRPSQSLRFFSYLKEEIVLLSGYLYWRFIPVMGWTAHRAFPLSHIELFGFFNLITVLWPKLGTWQVYGFALFPFTCRFFTQMTSWFLMTFVECFCRKSFL